MKGWIYLHRKMLGTIIVLVLIILLFVRVFVFYETDDSGKIDVSGVVRSLFDELISTILTSILIWVGIRWIKPPSEDGEAEEFIQPFQIDECLRESALNSREWYYLGHTAKYVRSQIFPSLHAESVAKNENKKIKLIILNPEIDSLCDFYAKYRNESRSNLIAKKKWHGSKVKNDLIASILCMIILHQKNMKLEISVGLINYVTLFRVDVNSNIALITQEDSQEPAIRYSSDSHFYSCYRRYIDLIWTQCKKVNITNDGGILDTNSAESIRNCLTSAGLCLENVSDSDLIEAGLLAEKRESPYVSR